MIIDTHVHYNLSPLYEEWQTFRKESKTAGIGASIVVGTDTESNIKAVEISTQEPELFCTVGYHPTDTKLENIDEAIKTLETLLRTQKKIVAIGECGLDYFHLSKDSQTAVQEKRQQKILFGKQIQLAKQYNLPLSIHCRDAQQDLMDTLNHFSKDDGIMPQAVLHCMSGTVDYLKQALDLGFYISFAGNVTYKNAELLRTLALNTPKDRILVETDAPFLAPQSKRGQTNHPQNIIETVTFLADLLHLDFYELSEITTQNAAQLFRLKLA